MSGEPRVEFQDLGARLIRRHTENGWVALRDDLLDRALRSFRPSAPVRGRHDAGDFFVAAEALVALLRRSVDAEPQAAASDITCETDGSDVLVSVTIRLVAAYGAHLVTLADAVRARALVELQEVLGVLAPEIARIHTHVHVEDVHRDPRML